MNNMMNQILKMTIGDVKKHPKYQEVLRMTYGKSNEEIQQMCQNIAQQNGINLGDFMNNFK